MPSKYTLAFVGPAEGDLDSLERLLVDALDRAKADRVIYLGNDDAADEVVSALARRRVGDTGHAAAFLAEAVVLTLGGTPAQIDEFLARDAAVDRLARVCRVPAPPARAVEFVDDRVVTLVHDKATLTEEDIANASVLVYGRGPEPFVRQFGPRCFLTPGPAPRGVLGVAELDAEGQVQLGLEQLGGKSVWRDVVAGQRSSRMSVSL